MNKVVCIKCNNEISQRLKIRNNFEWDEYDDANWENGIVDCIKCDDDFVNLENGPPDGCPYKLEHLVL